MPRLSSSCRAQAVGGGKAYYFKVGLRGAGDGQAQVSLPPHRKQRTAPVRTVRQRRVLISIRRGLMGSGFQTDIFDSAWLLAGLVLRYFSDSHGEAVLGLSER